MLQLRTARPDIDLGHIRLCRPVMADFSAWARLRGESRDFLQPWEPLWPRDDLTRPAFTRRIRRYRRERARDTGYVWFLKDSQDVLMGGVSLTNIRRGVAQSGTLGYWMGAAFADRGHMFCAMTGLLDYCFTDLNLHRVEAASMLTNARSIHLLQKLGFEYEGRARQYLRINGVWEDHNLYGLLRPENRIG